MTKIPLLLYPANAYLGYIAFSGTANHVLVNLPLPSGTTLSVTTEAVILLAGIGLLGTELARQMSSRAESYLNHTLSALGAVAATIGFMVFEPLGTITWAAVTMMMWVDVVVGVFAGARLSSRHRIWIESK